MASKASSLDKTIDALADAVPEAIKHLRAFLAYEGSNPVYYQKAKVGGVILGSYTKAEGTKTNRMAVEAATARMVPTSLIANSNVVTGDVEAS